MSSRNVATGDLSNNLYFDELDNSVSGRNVLFVDKIAIFEDREIHFHKGGLPESQKTKDSMTFPFPFTHGDRVQHRKESFESATTEVHLDQSPPLSLCKSYHHRRD